MKIQRLPPSTSKIAYLGSTCQFLVKTSQATQISMNYGQKVTVLKDCAKAGAYTVFYEVMQLGQHILIADQTRFIFTVMNPFNLRTKITRSRLYDILEVQLINMTDQTIFLQEFMLEGIENGLFGHYDNSFYSKVRQDASVQCSHPLAKTVFQFHSMTILKGATYIQSFLTPQNNSDTFGKIEMRYVSGNGELGHLQTPNIPKKITNIAHNNIACKILNPIVEPLGKVKVEIESIGKNKVTLKPNTSTIPDRTELELNALEKEIVEIQVPGKLGYLDLGTFVDIHENVGKLGHCIITGTQ
eukprot:NODE_379_length_9676_cov_0.362222.p3 type:complete len:300 gc:universal NODE_379_length_9676_cov_0.362222:4267-5166(+)